MNVEAEDQPCRWRKWIDDPDMTQGPPRMKSQAVRDASEKRIGRRDQPLSDLWRKRIDGSACGGLDCWLTKPKPRPPKIVRRSHLDLSRRGELNRQVRSCRVGSIH